MKVHLPKSFSKSSFIHKNIKQPCSRASVKRAARPFTPKEKPIPTPQLPPAHAPPTPQNRLKAIPMHPAPEPEAVPLPERTAAHQHQSSSSEWGRAPG